MLDVRRLRVLREVARCGSFSGAAEALGYTQPAISRHVALLERETGATLLERRPGGVRLTDAGALLVRHADGILARLRDAEEDLDDLLRRAHDRPARRRGVPPAAARGRAVGVDGGAARGPGDPARRRGGSGP